MWGPRTLLDPGPPSTSTDDILRPAGVWRCSLSTKTAKHYKVPVQTASAHISFSLKDNTFRSNYLEQTPNNTCTDGRTWRRNWWAYLWLDQNTRLDPRSKAAQKRGEELPHARQATQIQSGSSLSGCSYKCVCVLLITTGFSCVHSVGLGVRGYI